MPTLVGERLTLKSVAEPDSETDCEPPEASSLIVKTPVRVPLALGANVTLIEQLELAASVAGQLLLCVKSPEVAMEAIFIGTAPLLLSVTGLMALCIPTAVVANARLPGETLAIGTAPVPESGTVSYEKNCASLLIPRTPLRDPDAEGVKITLIMQLAPGATEDPQLFDCAKSPDVEMEPMLSDMVPLFVMLTGDAPVLVPTFVAGKVRLNGDRVAVDAPPEPVRSTSCSLPVTPPESSITTTSP
jgi:hypothetical protein